MKKKPVIDYGWTSFKYALLLVIAVVIGITSTYLFYRKKASALYIAEELYKYEDLNISGFEEILSKDLKKELTPGIETKVILYNDDIKSFDGYLGVVEVYNSEPYARIRRSSLKYANMYYDSLTNDYTFLMNNKNNVYLYKNVILRLSPYVTEEWEDLFINYLKDVLLEVTLNNKSVMTPREINTKTEEVNRKIKAYIDANYNKKTKQRIEF
jgi:hypothetical protein